MSDKFCLRWNDFESNISTALKDLKDDEDLQNVTLVAGDSQVLQAHKLILSACSPFFRTILKINKHSHPMLYLKGVRYPDLVALIDFIYYGSVNIAQDDLNSFLAVAEDLKIKGLTQGEEESDNKPVPTPESPKPNLQRSQRSQAPPPRHLPASLPDCQEDDIQEVPTLPVKTESGALAEVVAETGDGRYDEEYAEYEGYEDDPGYHDNGVLLAPGCDGNKDVSVVRYKESLMSRVLMSDGRAVWRCKECGKQHHNKSNIVQHVDLHIQGLEYTCQYCVRVFKSQGSLNVHITNKHRDEHKKNKSLIHN